jgi:hypothetical protein
MFVSHAVYLSADERKLLATGPCTLETTGVSVSSDQERAGEELFGRYLLTNEMSEGPQIEAMPDGYKLYITPKQCKNLLPLPDGIEWLHIKISQDDHHQIVIQGLEVLEQTIVIGDFALPVVPATPSKPLPAPADDETQLPAAH